MFIIKNTKLLTSTLNYFKLSKKRYFTKSSKISLWCTWMVIRVSNFTLSNLLRSCVVWLIKVFRISKNFWLVICMIFLSSFALFKASSESCVHNIWIPRSPTYKSNKQICQIFKTDPTIKSGGQTKTDMHFSTPKSSFLKVSSQFFFLHNF